MQSSSTGKAARFRSDAKPMQLIELASKTQVREFPPTIWIGCSNDSIGWTEPARENLAARVWGWRLSNTWRKPMAEKLLSIRALVKELNLRLSFHGRLKVLVNR